MTDKIIGTPEAWEEGPLGKDPKFAIALSPEEQAADEAAIDAAFGLKPISIRMEIEVLESLKAIAKHRGLGYQPLIRQVLHRWVDSELKLIALESMDTNEEKEVKVGCPALQQALPKAA
ncbi:BrnA antitoxin family protein [Quatrionicoccus australiensis]|uniref:BrnA antitoxin family protein n=1 Tax=Quatrionicoccus australiensis TaxID=138118 RepID=UPI001CF9F5E1|nr:BrnA antitoxin family protein [Quatrionicoccus australiensis]MCB4360909.1 hypothetical protein [Quatrionicoccus australiensis]